MLTITLILLPLLVSLLMFFLGKKGFGRLAFIASLAELALALVAFAGYDRTLPSNYSVDLPWINFMGIHFSFAMDGISLLLVMLTTVLVPFIIGAAISRPNNYPSSFFALILLMQSALVGVFTTTDAFLFYIFWEMALIPVYFIAAIWGGENRIRITLKFFIYTMLGSLFMLAVLVFLYLKTPAPHVFSISAITHLPLTPNEQLWVFAGFFLAFAIKMPVFPFHSWQPDTYTTAPTAGSMLLAGIMLKMGIYGVFRFLLPACPAIMPQAAPVAMALAVIGLLYGSVIAIKQQEVKRLIAYSSFAHVGLMAAALFALTADALQGAVYQMLSHGVNVVALFFVADVIQNRAGTTRLSELGGIARSAPRFAVFFMVVMLGSVALPLTNGFIGEWLMLAGIARYSIWVAAVAGLSIILGAIYMFRLYQHSMYGESNTVTASFADLTAREMIFAVPIMLMVVGMGLFPKPLLDIAQPAVMNLLSNFH